MTIDELTRPITSSWPLAQCMDSQFHSAQSPRRGALDLSVVRRRHGRLDRVKLRASLADVYGATRHEHRARVERGLVALSGSGEARLAVFAGAVDDLTDYVDRLGGDVADPDLRQGYVEQEQTHSTRRLWPPQRNEVCWCGSGVKYKRCCLPRSRT